MRGEREREMLGERKKGESISRELTKIVISKFYAFSTNVTVFGEVSFRFETINF